MKVSPGHVHVWYRWTESMSPAAVATARALLSPGERSRCDRYRFARDRRDYTAAHALLRSSLSRYCNVEPRAWIFETVQGGKPQVRMHPRATEVELSFNLSHASGIVGCAIAADTAVGIDIERTDFPYDWSPIASRHFSDEEINQISRCAPQSRRTRFIELWTLKEAYLKATGQGLSEDLRNVRFHVESGGVRFLPSRNVDIRSWQFALFPVEPDARIGVAVNCREVPAVTLTRTGD